MPFRTVKNLLSPTGAKLATRYQPAEGKPRAILVIEHGLAEHSGRYLEFAHFMARRGFHVHAHDHRGHGLTAAADAPQGVFAARNGADVVLLDCLAVREHAARVHPGLPVVVFGHSMGGLVALNFAQAWPDKLDALAVWNANFDAGPAAIAAQAILAVERMFLGSDVPSPMLPRLTFDAWGKAVANPRTPCRLAVEQVRGGRRLSRRPALRLQAERLHVARRLCPHQAGRQRRRACGACRNRCRSTWSAAAATRRPATARRCAGSPNGRVAPG